MPDNEYEDLRRTAGYAKLRALLAAFLTFSAVAMLGAMAGVFYLVLQAGTQSEQNFRVLERVEESNDLLIDCTQPGGKCFAESQSRTGQAVAGINEATLAVIVAALTCQADGIEGERELARCTARLASN